MPLTSKVSKNQRSGPKQAQKKILCPNVYTDPKTGLVTQHEKVNVLVVGHGMRWLCSCDGYAAIDTGAPYKQRKSRIKTGGKARIWFEQPSPPDA